MNDETVRFTVALSIAEGKLEAFEAIARTMVAGSESEAGTLVYEFCFSNDRKRCRLVEKYVDADATVAHLTGAVVQDPMSDRVVWREYLETVVRERDDWGAFYRACREVAG